MSERFKIIFKTRLKWILSYVPFYQYNQYVPFLIVGHPRTGTTLLHTYLNSHLNILSLNEALSYTNDGIALFKNFPRLIKLVGFKFFYEYTDNEQKKESFSNLLKMNNIKIVRIKRQNFLRTYVSLKIAEKTNEWSRTGKSDFQINDKKIALSKEEIFNAYQYFNQLEKVVNDLLKENQIACFDLDYEDLVNNPENVLNDVLQFFGLKNQKLSTLLEKQNPESLKDLIINYDELEKELKETLFYNMLTDN